MENVTEFVVGAGAFIAGLVTNFKDADKRTKALYLIGGIVCLGVALALIQAVVG